jgi:hypothetical protein
MSARIESLGTRNRTLESAWLALVAAMLVLLAVVLIGRIGVQTQSPVAPPAVRPPATSTTVEPESGAAIKVLANDPFIHQTGQGLDGASTAVVGHDPAYGPVFNMGPKCPKCW